MSDEGSMDFISLAWFIAIYVGVLDVLHLALPLAPDLLQGLQVILAIRRSVPLLTCSFSWTIRATQVDDSHDDDAKDDESSADDSADVSTAETHR